jgi:hypothetical protein
MNIGHSARLGYDKCAYEDRLTESTDPLSYRLYPGYVYNCDSCLSTLGPRSTHNSADISTPVGQPPATAQQLADVESILTNRNMKTSKCRKYGANSIDVNKFPLNHARICNTFLNQDPTRLSYPAYNYKEVAVNRFYNLQKDAQANIFWDFAENTKLSAKDSYMPDVSPVNGLDASLPKELKGKPANTCRYSC